MKKLEDFTPQEIEALNREIDNMAHESMARCWRYSPSGDVMFRSDLPFYYRFKKRFFGELGGFTPEISKRIGWE